MQKPTSIIFNEQDNDIIEWLKQNRGIRSTSEIVRIALREWRDSLYPAYLQKKDNAKPRTTYATAEERVQAQLEKKKKEDETRIALEHERGLKICSALDGKATELPNGEWECEWKIYEKAGKSVAVGKRSSSLDMLHENMIRDQYRGGTKEEVQAILASKK